MLKLKYTLIFIIPAALGITLLFQNCGQLGSFDQADQPFSSTGEGTPQQDSLSGNGSASNKKLGLVLGPNSTQFAIDKMADVGSWYYTYSTHPDRDDPENQFQTSTWANKYGKEFAPMAYGGRFKLGATNSRCPLLEAFALTGESVCEDDQILSTLRSVKGLFNANNKPRFLMLFNEPYLAGPHRAPQTGRSYKMTPWQAAASMSRLGKAATALNLKLVSPTLGGGADAKIWFAEFLKRCVDLKDDVDFPCDIEEMPIFSYHAYKCEKDFFTNQLGQGALLASLLSHLQTQQGENYGGVNWRGYLQSRNVWLTETTCNWDDDFQEAQRRGEYIRTQRESCLRSTGQRQGYGSLQDLAKLNDASLSRVAWWTTYANPQQDTDIDTVNQSSVNRITAARLVDDNGNKTAMGRAITAFSKKQDLLKVRCQ